MSSLLLAVILAGHCANAVVTGGSVTPKQMEAMHEGCKRNYGKTYCAVKVDVRPNQHFNVTCGDRP